MNLKFSEERLTKLLLSLFDKSWRYIETGFTEYIPSKQKNYIYSVWHETIIPMTCYMKDFTMAEKADVSIIVSNSRDGKLASKIVRDWKGKVITGSTRKKGMTAIRESVRTLKNNGNLFISPDGPLGPRQETKSGIAQIALLTNTPIIPVHIIPNRYARLLSWDKTIIPYPFTRIEIRYGKAIYPDASSRSPETIDHLTKQVQTAMTTFQKEVP